MEVTYREVQETENWISSMFLLLPETCSLCLFWLSLLISV